MHSRDLRRKNRTDGTGVDAPVGVATNLSIDRANIQAGATTNAAKGLGGEIIFKQF